jgi:hypothetical protein
MEQNIRIQSGQKYNAGATLWTQIEKHGVQNYIVSGTNYQC